MISIPYLTALTTYFSYGLLFVFGQIRDFFRKIIDWWSANNLQVFFFIFYFLVVVVWWLLDCARLCLLLIGCWHLILVRQGYAPICLGLEDFYIRRLYLRIQVSVRAVIWLKIVKLLALF